MILLYRCLYALAYVLLKVLKPFLPGKAMEMITDKDLGFFVINTQTREWIASQRPFWIHAASGEIEYARPVIRELKKNFPQIPVIVTFSSPSAKKILKNLPEVDAWGALPWDRRRDCQEFLTAWQPRCWLVARTDVWPMIAQTCWQSGIPSLLFSATFARNSSRLKGLSKLITRKALSQLTDIHCVSEEDAENLARLGLQTPIAITGDTRFDQVFYRLEHPQTLQESLRPLPSENIFVAGSTWPEDEAVLLPSLQELKDQCRCILAPHEVHELHFLELEKQLKEAGLSFCRYSDSEAWTEDVLLIDRVGILAELYTWGRCAFVGGSFRKQVHSVMEPLAAGLPVFVGPRYENNREAVMFKNKHLLGQNIVNISQNSKEMTSMLRQTFLNLSADFPRQLRAELTKHQASTSHVISWCAAKTPEPAR